jgi:hypothetical protein
MTSIIDTVNIPMLRFDKEGNLSIIPALTSSQDDFDFYIGEWTVKNKKLKTRLSNCNEWIEFDTTVKMYKVLNGFGNIDNIYATFDGKPFEGMSVRFFNPQTKLWSIHWADTNTFSIDAPTVGSFDSEFGHFFTQDTVKGQNIFVVYRWDIRDKNKPIWSQAFSNDKGENWEWNWHMYFTRA